MVEFKEHTGWKMRLLRQVANFKWGTQNTNRWNKDIKGFRQPEENGQKRMRNEGQRKIKDVRRYLCSLQRKLDCELMCSALRSPVWVHVCVSAWVLSPVTHAGPCTMDQLVKTKSSSCYPPGSHTAVHRTILCVCVCARAASEWQFTNPGDWANDVPCLTKSKHQEVVERGRIDRKKVKWNMAREK